MGVNLGVILHQQIRKQKELKLSLSETQFDFVNLKNAYLSTIEYYFTHKSIKYDEILTLEYQLF